MARLTRAFFDRHALELAPDLIGCRLVHELAPGLRLVGRIVEVEAYVGDGSDPASHAHRGPTPRNASMFGPPGRLYVYRSMGLHACANVVCDSAGRGAAVLLRGVEPLEGIGEMARRRGGAGRGVADGPGKLCQAFGIELAHDGRSLLRGSLRIEPAEAVPQRILRGPRIGISKAVDLPYRFFAAQSPGVSRSPQNRRARPLRPAARGARA